MVEKGRPDVSDTVLPIYQCGAQVLRRRAEPVDARALGSAELQTLIARMRATMLAAPGVGLAAPQVGVPLQLAVLQDGPDQWGPAATEAVRAARGRVELPFTVLVNPEVQPEGDDMVTFYEGCLSVPHLTAAVARYRSVRVQGLDENGQPVDRVFSGWPARIVQHEVDHLNGRLYLDRAELRSLCTVDNYGEHWAGRPLPEVGAELGFEVLGGD